MEKKAGVYFRIIHRYLGFYLVGIMAVYSVSGITLIFRRTDTFKKVTEVKTQLRPQLNENELGKNLKIRNLRFTNSQDNIFYPPGWSHEKDYMTAKMIRDEYLKTNIN